MKAISSVALALAAIIATPTASAQTFTYGAKTVSCAQAVNYRDNALYTQLSTALDNFDATREARINAALARLDVDIAIVGKDIEKADAKLMRRLVTVAAAIAVSDAASAVASVGVKPGASVIERQALEGLKTRAGEWGSVFTSYAGNGNVDVSAVAMMPVTFLLAFSPVGAPALFVWELGSTSIEVADALGERYIARGESKLTLAILRERSASLVRSLRKPDLVTMNTLKNEIDRQCGH